MKKGLFIVLLIAQSMVAQTISGNFPELKAAQVLLRGYNGFQEHELATTTTDSAGNFTLTYPKEYVGAALLQIKNSKSIIVLLNHENFSMSWSNLQDINTLQFANSIENEAFTKGITLNQEIESKLTGLKFLLPQYKTTSKQHKWLQQEIRQQTQRFQNHLNQLPKTSYARYYLKIRKLITDMPLTANRYIERMPKHEEDFKNLNFSEDYLWHSGLLNELFDGFYQLMESHIEVEKVTQHANLATDEWVKNLATQPTKQQDVAEHCFKWLEKRSLFAAAEHLAKAMLNQTNCQIDQKRTNLFEQYRKLAIGNPAPNIQLNNNQWLSTLNSNYILVAFGASWCPNCQTDYPKLNQGYKNLKDTYGLEIVYISIDTDKNAFETYYKDALFITHCDTQGWETQAAKDYHIFATPTYILLDKNLKIVAKINTPEHLEAWLQAHKGQ